MRTEALTTWAEQNRAYLLREFSVLQRRLGEDSAAEVQEGPAEPMERPAAIDALASIFELSSFERELLLLCAGVEMEPTLGERCAQLAGHPRRGFVTFGLAMSLLSDPHWSALTPLGPLRRFRLVELEPGHGLTSAPLRIDERILHYLAGLNLLDQRLQTLIRLSPFPEWIADDHKLVAARAAQVFQPVLPNSPIVHLCGDDPQGQEDAAALAVHQAGWHLFSASAEDLPAPGPDLEQVITLWDREALLLPGALMIQCAQGGFTPSARHVIDRLRGPVVLASREPVRLDRTFVRLDVNKPAPTEQKKLWEKALGAAAIGFNGAVDALSEQFRLSARAIYSASALAGSDGDALQPEQVWNVCRSLARPRLEDLAQRIVPCAGWEDLVLPELQIRILRQLAAQARHRATVYERWGFARRGRRGLGLSALFSGPSGTGKTLAAEVLAADLRLDLYRIDLSAVVSKYIGETEKNLRQVFDAAETGGVLLLFDEADAIFGKRAEVKDSHDRYANIEVSYMLQRMENFQGLAILTTNMKSAVDRAFQRRLRFMVDFPFPDATQREAIWRRVFPPQTPTEGLQPALLANLNVAGGNIRNIALNAAFLAAEQDSPVRMQHVLEATHLEVVKVERPISKVEVRGWV